MTARKTKLPTHKWYMVTHILFSIYLDLHMLKDVCDKHTYLLRHIIITKYKIKMKLFVCI